MDNRTQNKINSFDAMREVMVDPSSAPALTANQGFNDECEEFRDTRAVMLPFMQIAAGKTAGLTINKDRVRQALIKKAVFLSAGGFAFGRKVGNPELEALCDTHKTDWKGKRGGEIETNAQNLHDALAAAILAGAQGNPPVKIDRYQVTDAALTEFQTNIDALSLVEQGPRAKQGMIGGALDQVKALVEQLDVKKETLRRLLPQLEDGFPVFAEAMRGAMTIVDSAASHGGAAPAKPTP